MQKKLNVSFKPFSMFLFLASAILSGFLAPFNLMFYSRNFLGDLGILDYSILGGSVLIGLLLIAIFQRYAKIILFLGEGLLLIANIIITNVISINFNNLTASGAFAFFMFGESITIARITLPLILFIFSGLFMLGSTMDLISFSNLFNQRTDFERLKFIGLSVLLAFLLNAIIRSIDIQSVYMIFFIAPTGIIISTYSYLFLRFKGQIMTFSSSLRDQNKYFLGTNKPKRGFTSTIGKGFVFFFLSIAVTINLGIANLSVFPLANLNNSILIWVLTLFFSAGGSFCLVLLGKKARIEIFLMLIISILPIISFILSYYPLIPYNLIITSIIYGVDMGVLVVIICRIIAEKTDMPGTMTAFTFLLLVIVGYISRTPLYREEVWDQKTIFLPILVCCLFIAIFTTWLIKKIPDKFSLEGSK